MRYAAAGADSAADQLAVDVVSSATFFPAVDLSVISGICLGGLMV